MGGRLGREEEEGGLVREEEEGRRKRRRRRFTCSRTSSRRAARALREELCRSRARRGRQPWEQKNCLSHFCWTDQS